MQEPEFEPESDKPRPLMAGIGWRVVAASLLMTLAYVVTESAALTLIVASFGTLLLVQTHPLIAEFVEHDPFSRILNIVAPLIVLLIFVGALVRNLLR